ncbi:MAG TPA: ATP-binding cassette domain-containing protein [Candidatus Lokiarchaeia archaeon]|nr:ATP-binding cassette domain-containing protein [Candidatus Lokiarchaeia archaeon]
MHVDESNEPLHEITKQAAIEFEHFYFRYGDSGPFALNDISLSMDRGMVVFLGGPSGAGKSTLCNAIASLIPFRITGQMKGTVRLFSRDIFDYTTEEIAGLVGFVFQNTDEQLITFTVFDEIAFAAENLRISAEKIRERVQDIAQKLHIADLLNRDVASLSGGEKQKVIIAANIVMLPKILIFDEPTAFLDVTTERLLVRTLEELHESDPSLTLVIVDHRLSPFEDIVDKMIILDGQGHLAFSGTPEAYKKLPAEQGIPIVRTETNYPNFETFLALNDHCTVFDGSRSSKGTPLIDMDDVAYAYPGGHQVFEHVSFSIQKGEFVGLIGENGSGKTTMLYLMARVLNPIDGHVFIDGIDVENIPAKLMYRRIGFIFQNPENQIFESTVADELLYGPRNLVESRDDHSRTLEETLVNQYTALIGDARLSYADLARKNPFRLSWGQKRRLNLGSILSYNPDIILLDEPFIGQDRIAVDRIFEILHDANERGKTIVLVSHDLDLVKEQCSRVIYLGHEETARDEDDERSIVAASYQPIVMPEGFSGEHAGGTKPRLVQENRRKNSRKKARKGAKLDEFLSRNFRPSLSKPPSSRFHPIAKIACIIALTVVAFFQQSLLVLGTIYLATLVIAWHAQGNLKKLLLQLRIVLIFTIIYVPLNALFNATPQPGEIVFFYLIPPYFPIRHIAFYVSIRYGLIIMTLFTSTVAFNWTTPLKDFIYSLMQARVPYRYAFAFIAGLRYIPLVRNEVSTIEIAQRLRGDGIGKKSNVKVVFRHLVHRISTLLISIFRKINTTSTAMEIRGFGAYKTRTNLFVIPWKRRDSVMVFAAITLGIFGVLLGLGVVVAAHLPSILSLVKLTI